MAVPPSGLEATGTGSSRVRAALVHYVARFHCSLLLPLIQDERRGSALVDGGRHRVAHILHVPRDRLGEAKAKHRPARD